MRFVVDAQLPPVLASWLRAHGHEADHVGATLGLSAPDEAIAQFAVGAVIVSKDADFIGFLEGGSDAPQLLWIRMGNTTNRALLERLGAQWPRLERELLDGAAVVEAH